MNPASPDLATSVVTVASPGSVAVGDTITVMLQAVDSYGNNEPDVAVSFNLISPNGGKGKFGKVTYNSTNNTYTVTFKGTTAGKNSITATINGKKLTSAPAAITVS